jgi:uncharacterized protein YdaU (DUF1376 family)
MTRPPAFQFYAADFMYGCRTLTLEERGAYITLLCHQWDKGSVPGDDLKTLALVLGTSGFSARKLWLKIADKFPRLSHGFANRRLELERVKQARFRRKMAQNGKKGGRPPKKPQVMNRLLKTKAEKSSLSSSSEYVHPPNPPQRGARRMAKADPWQQQEKMAEMQRLMADGLSRLEAERKAFN